MQVQTKVNFLSFPAAKSLAWDLTENHISMDMNGYISIPEEVGHGMKINQSALDQYNVDVEIFVNKEKIF